MSLIDQMNEVIARRAMGMDTADDSAFIKGFLDYYPPGTPEGDVIARAFSVEYTEWDEEKEMGYR